MSGGVTCLDCVHVADGYPGLSLYSATIRLPMKISRGTSRVSPLTKRGSSHTALLHIVWRMAGPVSRLDTITNAFGTRGSILLMDFSGCTDGLLCASLRERLLGIN